MNFPTDKNMNDASNTIPACDIYICLIIYTKYMYIGENYLQDNKRAVQNNHQ